MELNRLITGDYMEFKHKSVLLDECIENLNIKSDGIYVDGTLGGAGHSKEIVKRLDTGKLIAFDKDIEAIENSKKVLEDYMDKVILIHDSFENIKFNLQKLGIDKINGLLLDLGVSSYQLDNEKRGFSYMNDAPLDMRMDTNQSFSAYNVVNEYPYKDLSKIIKMYGEENWHSRIAQFIVDYRKKSPIRTTLELVDVIKAAVPKGARDISLHPAKRTFQAIRIEVNNELEIIEKTIKDSFDIMEEGGVVAIITFHSLEDRIVKNCYREMSKECECPPNFPICVCNRKAIAKVINKKPIVATEGELDFNSRARSAKLRIAVRI